MIQAAKLGSRTWGESVLSLFWNPPPSDLQGEWCNGIAFSVPCSRGITRWGECGTGIDNDNDNTFMQQVPGCKIMPAIGGVYWSGTDEPPQPFERHVQTGGGQGANAVWTYSQQKTPWWIEIIDRVNYHRLAIGTHTNEIYFFLPPFSLAPILRDKTQYSALSWECIFNNDDTVPDPQTHTPMKRWDCPLSAYIIIFGGTMSGFLIKMCQSYVIVCCGCIIFTVLMM